MRLHQCLSGCDHWIGHDASYEFTIKAGCVSEADAPKLRPESTCELARRARPVRVFVSSGASDRCQKLPHDVCLSHRYSIDCDSKYCQDISVNKAAISEGMTIDELAAHAAVPSRTIREYQRLGLLHSPRREQRVGVYDQQHRSRLAVIARLQGRGYSLAAIGDLLDNWEAGRGLGSVIGADADPAVLDEVPTEMSVQELVAVAPCLGEESRRLQLRRAGIIAGGSGEKVIVRSVAAIELVGMSERAGVDPDAAVGVALAVRDGAASVAEAVVGAFLAQIWEDRQADAPLASIVRRARLLLAQSTASLVVDRLGAAMAQAAAERDDPELRSLVEEIRIGAFRVLPSQEKLESAK
jgi:DNA-binding transcriptional MerR regulator